MTQDELIFELLITEDKENLLMRELNCNVDSFILNTVEELVEQLNGNQIVKHEQTKEESIIDALRYGSPNDEIVVEMIYDISIAIAELNFLRFGLNKNKAPIDFKRFCNVLVEQNKLINFDVPLVMALKYCFEILQSDELAPEKLMRIGSLRSSAHTAMLNNEIIYNTASQFNPVDKNSELPPAFLEIESEVREIIQSALKQNPNSGRLRMKAKEWINNQIDNYAVFASMPEKWLTRIVKEEKYLFDMLNNWPVSGKYRTNSHLLEK